MMHFLDNYMLIWYHYLLVLHPQTVLGLSTDRIATGVNILPNDTKISGHNWCFEIGERLHTQPTPAKKTRRALKIYETKCAKLIFTAV